jgi:hypothetical protein
MTAGFTRQKSSVRSRVRPLNSFAALLVTLSSDTVGSDASQTAVNAATGTNRKHTGSTLGQAAADSRVLR